MRTQLAIRRELARVVAAKNRAENTDDRKSLYGAEQALAWALGQNAMAPSRAFAPLRAAIKKAEEG